MAKIEGFRVKNFRALQDVTLGRLWNTPKVEALTPLTAVIGQNGVGKSSLFDAFGFLSDCLRNGVEEACYLSGRGGFERIRSKGSTEPIEFEIYYRQDGNSRPITYELRIDIDKNNQTFIKSERLRQRRKGQSKGRPFSFLLLEDGKGAVWKGEEALQTKDVDFNLLSSQEILELIENGSSEETSETDFIELRDNRRLGIATLGTLKQHPRIAAFREFIEGWYLSYFTPDAARSLPMAGPQRHLNIHADNLSNVVQYMEKEYPKQFETILARISSKIPGINRISTKQTDDNRLLLQFNDRGFNDPFYAQNMSDGTLKIFAYLLLLEDPFPPPFICIEEPENGLYHQLLETLAHEFRSHATGLKGGSQVFITTHQPQFVDALEPDEVWVLSKGNDGFSTIRRASDFAHIQAMVDEGQPLGSLWYSDYLSEGTVNAL